MQHGIRNCRTPVCRRTSRTTNPPDDVPVRGCLGLVLPSYQGTTTRKRSSSAPGPLPHLSSRVFASYTDLVDHCCEAWNKLIERPWKIVSVGVRDWIMGSNQRDLGLRSLGAKICR